ncbi:sce7726 family protein [Paenibacillus sp. ClWae2A]|uniref:sce7726 family protein n=1 Tax=Paenibacillus sp. ClWae2A TaxID=3057177 RepID=UPI0028F5C8C7|nr:sce7726 family protein [Paenibacillus sp. ClWae2A]MDT9719648.1 sce7726 family protein [Paenibacillus sp. ClWae2A]
MDKLRDPEIREVLIERLLQEHSNSSETLIINEMSVSQGLSRVDVAVLNGIMQGYEIKSESDKLIRLPLQANEYNKVFERMTIVTAENYLEGVKKIIPSWWGIIKVSNKKGIPTLRTVKKGRVNPSLDSLALAQLLWRDEAIDLLKKRGLEKGILSKPKREIYQRIAESIKAEELKIEVNQFLKSREGWRGHLLP